MINKKNQDITNYSFGKWLVLYRTFISNKKAKWYCRCSCGVEKEVDMYSLLKGESKSCGCIHHNMSKTPLHACWRSMIGRCINPKNQSYTKYGGRGITVCDRWLVFENFYEDMGDRPSKNHSLDRIDNNGNYSKENCRWATIDQQNLNKRNNRNIEFNGKTQCLELWAKELGIRQDTLWRRLKKWDSIERAFTEKIHTEKSHCGPKS